MNILKLFLIIAVNIAIALAGTVYKCKVTKTDIKSGAGSNYPYIGWLDKDNYIYVTNVTNGWAEFHVGWVNINDLTKQNSSTYNYKVNSDALNFREGPSINHNRIALLNKGTKVIYYGRDSWNNSWGVTNRGYCSMEYLSELSTNTTVISSTKTNVIQPSTYKSISREIINISRWNTVTNYASAASAIDGVIIRCGYRGYGSQGSLVKDSMLENHYKGFKDKTKIGYYFFSQAITVKEAEDEATYVVNTLIKGKQNNFPIYWYSESSGAPGNSGRADNLSKSVRTACAVAFVMKVKALGYRAGIYASEYWFNDNLDYNKIVNAGASIWVAKYSSEKPITSSYDSWQYSSTSYVKGISGNVDKSYVYKNIANW
ncbi:glycoside hydrolase family 25 protein [Piromyces sp. E2]|nr:glycoside hydrolase family 25 protein [Piromyces sp. E2]|eukprot:OUM58959.1 glycoside hydrolase family 25 protein [Piromyces sp. E2]